ncbi:MAG TPA: hypothetical protein VGU22_13170 [Methylomirabilota bacterium]|nr:hypothetical protein [Methylomirabilota bacterium]
MSAEPLIAEVERTPDGELLCYCTDLTFGELRAACRAGRWPPPGKERTGKLCTGCQGDLLVCLRSLGAGPAA